MRSRWMSMFHPRILHRGMEYYEEDRVEDLKHTENGWEAVVHGTYDYDVKIEATSSGRLVWCSCTCPYAESDNLCKHMAAVLFAIEENDETDTYMDHGRFRRELKELAYRYSEDGTYVSWRAAERYTERFAGLLEQTVDSCLKRKDVSEAFAVCRTAFAQMEEMDLSDAGDTQYELDDALEEALLKILKEADDELTAVIRSWVYSLHEKIDEIGHYCVIENIYEHGFNDPVHLERLYQEIRKDLEEAERSGDYEACDLYRYRDILIRMGKEQQELEDWLDAHADLDMVLCFRRQAAEEKEDWDAVYVLLQAEYARNTQPWQKESYLRRLYEISKKRNDPEGMKHWLSLYIQQKRQPQKAEVLELRSLCTKAEWEKIREDLLERCVYLRAAIYFEDGMYAELLENLRHCKISVTDRYADALKEVCPAQLAELYADHLGKLQERYPNKVLYEEMRKYLQILAGIPGGQKYAEKYMMDWLVRYPTRKAMQEMIREVNTQIHGNVVYMTNI